MRSLNTFAFALLAGLGLSAPAAACDAKGPWTREESIRRCSAIVEGSVVASHSEKPDTGPQDLTVRVDTVIRNTLAGPLPAQIHVSRGMCNDSDLPVAPEVPLIFCMYGDAAHLRTDFTFQPFPATPEARQQVADALAKLPTGSDPKPAP